MARSPTCRLGLTWKQCTEGLSGVDCATGSASTFTWQQALQHAEDGGVRGQYRVAVAEQEPAGVAAGATLLQSHYQCDVFSEHAIYWFWSSSPYAYYSGYAWSVYFGNGYVDGYPKSLPGIRSFGARRTVTLSFVFRVRAASAPSDATSSPPLPPAHRPGRWSRKTGTDHVFYKPSVPCFADIRLLSRSSRRALPGPSSDHGGHLLLQFR